MTTTPEILSIAREKVLDKGIGLNFDETLEVLKLDDEHIDDLLALAHEVPRMVW